jgi:hypothetical protein
MKFRITPGELYWALKDTPHPSSVNKDRIKVVIPESPRHFEMYPEVDVQMLEERVVEFEKSSDGSMWYLVGITGFKMEE